jgi:hypothetical protein
MLSFNPLILSQTLFNPLEAFEVIDAFLMSTPLKGSFEPGIDNLPGQGLSNHPSTHDQNIGIVVATAHNGRKKIIAKGGSNMGKFVRHH